VSYDVLVVGAGFAGSEAAYRLAQAGRRVGLLTQSLDSLFLPVTEITEPPVPGTLFSEVYEEGLPPFLLHARAKWRLEELAPELHLFQATATGLLVEDGRAVGVATWEGPEVRAGRVVLAVGTFLGARLQVGALEETAGRLGEAAYDDLFEDLKAKGFGFQEERVSAPPFKGAPGYEVRYHRFARDEFDPKTHRLRRFAGLFATGACVLGARGYAAMSADGRALAEALLEEG
jgi:tRNA U34 5-carboxymethylaminomethyl modifying enzyme MnmG/GidA